MRKRSGKEIADTVLLVSGERDQSQWLDKLMEKWNCTSEQAKILLEDTLQILDSWIKELDEKKVHLTTFIYSTLF